MVLSLSDEVSQYGSGVSLARLDRWGKKNAICIVILSILQKYQIRTKYCDNIILWDLWLLPTLRSASIFNTQQVL